MSRRAGSPTAVRRRRVWCFLVHRWWVPTIQPRVPTTWQPLDRSTYLCRRCGEVWSRS